jgi:dethiobiotin synthetase
LAAYCSFAKGLDVGVMKPFEPGLSLYGKDRLPWDAISLKEASGSQDDLALINPYAFDAPISPGAAAEIEHVQIDLEHLDRIFRQLSTAHEILIIEGAGGVLAPIQGKFFFSDLIRRWNLPALVVAKQGIGTVNHTLLTCRFLENQGIPVLGVILNDLAGKTDDATRTNKTVLSRYLDVPILGTFPFLKQTQIMDRPSLSDAFEKNVATGFIYR